LVAALLLVLSLIVELTRDLREAKALLEESAV
jgi:hypothetical protein